MRPTLRPGYVYVVESAAGDGVKIGVTRDLRARLAQLQTGCPHPLRMAWSTEVCGDAYAVEAEAHRLLDRHRVGGEWFAVSPEVAVAAVSGASYRCRAVDNQLPARRVPPWLKVPLVAFVASGTLIWIYKLGGRGVVILLIFPFCIAATVWILTRPRGYRLMSTALLVAGLAMAGLCAALADEARPPFPAIDSEAYCTKAVALLGDNPILKNGCLTNESDAKQNARRVWPDAPSKVESDCLKLSAFAAPSYQGIAGCLSISVGALWLKGDLKLTR